jgi:hypothetical protein
MRQTISGMIAAIAVVAAGTVPASACGLFESACGQVVEAPVYSGCNTGCRGGGWSYERLADPEQQYGYYAAPVHQYYYADQGPTYSGPGDFAPYPTYQESAVGGWGAYRHHHYHYGYDGGRYADATNHYYDGAPNVEGPAIYTYHPHMHGYHHGYSLPPRVYYGQHHNMRYGYHGAPHRYGYGAHMMHRRY